MVSNEALKLIREGRNRKANDLMGIPPRYHSKGFHNFTGELEQVNRAKTAVLVDGESVFLTGPCGSGKTHLAVALLNEWFADKLVSKTTPLGFENTSLDRNIAQIAELIYRSDPIMFARLIDWVKMCERDGYQTQAITDALERFWDRGERPENWWARLDWLLGKSPAKSRKQKHSHPSFLAACDLLYSLKSTFNENSESEKSIIDRYSTISILLIDDLGSEKISDWARQSFYILIDRRYRSRLQTIITSNLDLNQIAEFIDDRISSRMCEMGPVLRMDAHDGRLLSVDPAVRTPRRMLQ